MHLNNVERDLENFRDMLRKLAENRDLTSTEAAAVRGMANGLNKIQEDLEQRRAKQAKRMAPPENVVDFKMIAAGG